MKKTDCPLCNAKNVIVFHSKDQNVNHVIPDESTGNTELDIHGQGYDLSHADVCPNLKSAFLKRKLLEFYISGQPFMPVTDSRSFEQYQQIVKQKNLSFKVGLIRIPNGLGKMFWQPYACISSPALDHLVTYGEDGEAAFALLKHRLRCGDIVDTGRGKLQLIQKGESLALDAI